MLAFIVHPGQTLRYELEARDLSPEAFAAALDLSPAIVTGIIAGRGAITPDVAARLARYFGNGVDFWLALQSAYDDGATWAHMDACPRLSFATLTRADVPASAGVYALYRGGERVYVGTAASLVRRVWGNHARRTLASIRKSALRRNVAERLGIASSADILAARYIPTPDQLAAVRAWLDGCAIAWIVCDSAAAALRLEARLKAEYRPTLTKL